MNAPALKPHYKLVGGKPELQAHSAHIGADVDDPALKSWRPHAGSADSDLIPELDVLTPRARDLERNNGFASGSLQSLKDNVIGNVLKLSSKPSRHILGWDADESDAWAKNTEEWFETWFDSREFDVTGTQTGWGLSHTALHGAFMNGGAIGIPMFKRRPGGAWGTCIKLIEIDRLATPPKNVFGVNGGNTISGGVEVDKDGRPQAYWIRKQHPGDWMHGFGATAFNDFIRIPAFTSWGRQRVIHLFDKTRAGQSVGRSIFAPVMREFKVSDRYVKAELDAAVANALVAAFLESVSDPESVIGAYGGDAPGESYNDALKGFSMKTGPGAVVALPFGVKPSDHTPARPNVAFDGFMESILRKVSSGLNVPYEVLAKDFTKVNYASARAALMEAWRYFMTRRRWFVEGWLQPIYELWMEEAVDLGRVKAPDFYQKRAAYTRSKFIMSGRGWIDPWREARAAEQRMQSGVSNLEDESAEQGRDWRDVIEQRRIEIKAIRAAGIPMPSFIEEQQADSSAHADGK